jgi:hypothetical protein
MVAIFESLVVGAERNTRMVEGMLRAHREQKDELGRKPKRRQAGRTLRVWDGERPTDRFSCPWSAEIESAGIDFRALVPRNLIRVDAVVCVA